jgi:hypothetical protein
MDRPVVPLDRRAMLLLAAGAASAAALSKEPLALAAGGTASNSPDRDLGDIQSGLLTAWVRLVAGRDATVQLGYSKPYAAIVAMSKSVQVPGPIIPACRAANMLALTAVAQSWNVAIESLDRFGDRILHAQSGRTVTCRVWVDMRAA